MPLYLPDFSEIMAVAETRGDASDAPHLWRGLVGAWPLQEPAGGTAFDVIGRCHGTHALGPSHSITTGGRAITYNGSSQYSSLPAAYLLGATRFTLAFWIINQGGTDAVDVVMEHSTNYNNNSGSWILYIDNSAANRFYFSRRTTVGYNQQYCTPLAKNQLHHIVATCDEVAIDNPAWAAYFNAQSQALTATHTDVTTGLAIQSQLTYIGARAGTAHHTPMTLFGLSAWNRVLTPAEIQQLYADPWAMYRLRPSVFPAAVAEPVLTYRNYILGGGVI